MPFRRNRERRLTIIPGNPAARMVSTRPIEREGASDRVFEKASTWLNECQHGQIRGKRIHAICLTPKDNYMPTRLIEVSRHGDAYEMKLREMKDSPTEPYAALSYCWGGGDHSIKSVQALLSNWMAEIPWDQLPQTLRDAVIVCHKLHIRFLWIDAFCIVQDDPSDKDVEIAQMPNIYRNSTFTIAASRAAHVQDGFLGERSATELSEAAFQLPYQCQRPAARGSITLVRTLVRPEPLDLRGWALQERLLSPRTMEFGTHQLRFMCQHNPRGITDGWRLNPEGSESRQDNLVDLAVLQADFDSLQGDWHRVQGTPFEEPMDNWYKLVEVYTCRHLTLPIDRVLAISGIAERYGRVFGDQYCAGIWRSTFAKALYWKTDQTKLLPRPQVWQGPSWSWTAVDGPVTFESISSSDEDDLRIVGIEMELVNPVNPYGALLEGSGRLTLKVRLLSAVLSFREGLFGEVDTLGSSIRMNGSHDTGIFQVRISYDALDATEEERDMNNVVFLEMSSKCTDSAWSCRGLVARGLSEDTFTRIGTFDYRTRDEECRRKNESLEAWHKRVDREFSWFSRCQVRIIDLI